MRNWFYVIISIQSPLYVNKASPLFEFNSYLYIYLLRCADRGGNHDAQNAIIIHLLAQRK